MKTKTFWPGGTRPWRPLRSATGILRSLTSVSARRLTEKGIKYTIMMEKTLCWTVKYLQDLTRGKAFINSSHCTGSSLPRIVTRLCSTQHDGVVWIGRWRSHHTSGAVCVPVLSHSQCEHVEIVFWGSVSRLFMPGKYPFKLIKS